MKNSFNSANPQNVYCELIAYRDGKKILGCFNKYGMISEVEYELQNDEKYKIHLIANHSTRTFSVRIKEGNHSFVEFASNSWGKEWTKEVQGHTYMVQVNVVTEEEAYNYRNMEGGAINSCKS